MRVAAVLLVVLLFGADGGRADARTAGGNNTQDGATVWVELDESPGGSGAAGSTIQCTSTVVTKPGLANLVTPSDVIGHWILRRCSDVSADPPRQVSLAYVWVTEGDPAELARRAADTLVLPLPEVQTSPRRGAPAVVGLPTWFWTEPAGWQPQQASATLSGVTVTAVATPVETTVDAGGDERVVCPGPGRPYDVDRSPSANGRSDCALTFPSGGERQVTVATRWSLSWSATNGGGGELDDVVRTTSFTVPVRELQAVLEG